MKNLNDEMEPYKYFSFFGMLLVGCNIASNILAGRILEVNILGMSLLLPGGIIVFPATFAILDIVTEFYGYNRAVSLIKYNLICQGVFAAIVMLILGMQSKLPAFSENAFQHVLGTSASIFVASLTASAVSETVNCKILAKWKAYTNGKHLWLRAFGSTAIGELVFSCTWVFIFFHGKLPNSGMLLIIVSQYIVKILYEIFCLPLTYFAVSLLRTYENITQNRYKNFNPAIQVE